MPAPSFHSGPQPPCKLAGGLGSSQSRPHTSPRLFPNSKDFECHKFSLFSETRHNYTARVVLDLDPPASRPGITKGYQTVTPTQASKARRKSRSFPGLETQAQGGRLTRLRSHSWGGPATIQTQQSESGINKKILIWLSPGAGSLQRSHFLPSIVGARFTSSLLSRSVGWGR